MRTAVPGVREVLQARIVRHAYPTHVHDTWTLFVVDSGEVRYDLGRHRRGARRSMVSVLPPNVPHDGRAASDGGYRKRVVYLEPAVLGADLVGHAVDRPFIEDRALRRAVDHLHAVLAVPDHALAAETVLALVAERVRAHLTARPVEDPPAGAAALAARLRDLLDARAFEPLTLAEAGRILGASPGHLVRSFTRTFAISPHAYVTARRVDAARARLLDGEPPAAVASAVGFFDQAHLTRHFKRHVGTTPGRFAQSGQAAST